MNCSGADSSGGRFRGPVLSNSVRGPNGLVWPPNSPEKIERTYFFIPFSNISEGFIFRHIVNAGDGIGTAIKLIHDNPEFFLTRGVPKLDFDWFSIDVESSDREFNSNCILFWINISAKEGSNEPRFSATWIPDHNRLQNRGWQAAVRHFSWLTLTTKYGDEWISDDENKKSKKANSLFWKSMITAMTKKENQSVGAGCCCTSRGSAKDVNFLFFYFLAV